MGNDIDLINLNKLVEFRQELHTHPELSGKEEATAQRILNYLKDLKPDEIIQNIGGNGIAIVFKGQEEGPSVLFRADMDALPIREINSFKHKSVVNGVSHKCGHDGHMAIVAGLADAFSKNPPQKGQAILLFQPAEENGEGAHLVVNDKNFKKLKIDYVFALHNLPGFPKGRVILRKNTFSAASKGIIIKLSGKTSHAAEPENGISPAIAMSNIVKELTLLPTEDRFSDFTLVTVIYARLGEVAFGTSPGEAEIMATIRSYSNADMEILTERAETIIKENTFRHRLKYELSYTEEFPATVNNNDLVDVINDLANENKIDTEELAHPFRWSEDFAHFTQKYKGVLFGIGSGTEHPQLHNPDYDFPDDIIETGVNMFYKIFNKIIQK